MWHELSLGLAFHREQQKANFDRKEGSTSVTLHNEGF
jgi:hypothetical protein